MPRLTPIELAIARKTEGKTDRQAAYEARKRKAGFTKTCVWVPSEDVAEFKELARQRCIAKEGQSDAS